MMRFMGMCGRGRPCVIQGLVKVCLADITKDHGKLLIQVRMT